MRVHPAVVFVLCAVFAVLSLGSAKASPLPPAVVMPLKVPGFRPASHVGPRDDTKWPQPVTIVLHGNFDRPEWECETWARAAAFRGFVLCPRGVPVKGIDKALDRWTYAGNKATAREIEATLSALEQLYPGRVTREHLVLVGFSLGAILAPKLAVQARCYEAIFLVEGGLSEFDAVGIEALSAAGVRGVGFAMSGPGRRKQAQRQVALLRGRGYPAAYVDMTGAGHNYSRDFEHTGRQAFEALMQQVAAAERVLVPVVREGKR